MMSILEISIIDEIVVSEACLILIVTRGVAHNLPQSDLACSRTGGRFSPHLLQSTQEVWQPLSKAAITEQDAEETLRNVLDLCHVLWKIETGRLVRNPDA